MTHGRVKFVSKGERDLENSIMPEERNVVAVLFPEPASELYPSLFPWTKSLASESAEERYVM